MPNFKSLNSSKQNLESVKDHDENARTTVTDQKKEKKDNAFYKYNINGENKRNKDEGGGD